MMDNLKLSLVILLTGIVVVFTVLVLLIVIIKLYSTAVSSAQTTIEAKKIEKSEKLKATEKSEVEKDKSATEQTQTSEQVEQAAAQPVDDGSIPGEIIAVIAAAVDTIFGEGAVTVQSIKKAKPQQASSRRKSAWRSAGIAENTRAF